MNSYSKSSAHDVHEETPHSHNDARATPRDMTTKILVAGDCKGQFDMLFDRVAALHASKGPFDLLLCVGDFLGDCEPDTSLAPFQRGERKAPLRTYVLGPAPTGFPAPDADGVVEVGSELFFLAGAGIVTLHGLRVAFASARGQGEAAAEGGNEGGGALTEGVAELRTRASDPRYTGCDLLLTHEWPRGFHRQLPEGSFPVDLLPERDLPSVGVERVAELAATARPRYHFCATEDAAFQRAPYRQPAHPSGGASLGSVCRLVALAAVGPDKKKKWLHALSLVPSRTMSVEQLAAAPDGTTETPYSYAPPMPLLPPPPPPPAGPSPGDGGARGSAEADARGGKRKREPFVRDARSWVHESCWFCLASPQFESHLVVSVGEEAYVCTAKGPLLPMHALILPIEHVPCSLFLSPPAAAEVDKMVESLRRYFESRGASLLLFERYMGSGSFEHAHLQAIPLPTQLAEGARAAFEAHGRKRGLGFEVLPPGERLASRLQTPEPFFAVSLPSGETLLHRIASVSRKHPLHFGREVIASMLGNPRRADWKVCLPVPAPGERASTAELEGRDALEFKRMFEKFDPNAE